ncbi:MAG TPA: amidohydrolase, partial [Clostridiales bacterium UBA8153]|nr:amidohydrolase [Clostridiales bacterium UBA8153]
FPQVRSIRDIQERVRSRARELGTAGDREVSRWVRGWGYDQLKLEERRHPTRVDLDEACPHLPVLLMRTCAHIAVVNSKVLELLGVTAETPDPVGGKYDRDEGGVPNGVLRETALSGVTRLGTPGHADTVAAIEAGGRDFLSLGITSVHEAGVLARDIRAFTEIAALGRTVPRVYMMLGYADPDFQASFLETGLATGFGNYRLTIGPLKLMTDGSSSGPTAATRRPYAVNPQDTGILYLTQEEIDARFARAHAGGMQLTAHAVGDRAVEMVINGIERALTACRRADPRHRIEHCAMTDPELRLRIKRLGIIPIPQPVFLHEFGDGYVANYGRERAEAMFATGSFQRLGIPFAMSTDCPVTFPDPLLNIYTAVTRQTMTGQVIGPEESIGVAGALSAYTMGGAFAAFEDTIKGSIEPGKLADLVVLSHNPLEVPLSELRQIRAELTLLGGEVVFERPG